MELVQCGVGPVWSWSSVCTHRANVNLLQPAPTQCDVDRVLVCIELLPTYFNLPQPPQPSLVLIQCVSPQSYNLFTTVALVTIIQYNVPKYNNY